MDWQASSANRVTGRYIHFENDSPANINSTTSGVPNSLEVVTDFVDAMNSTAVQVVSTGHEQPERAALAVRAPSSVPASERVFGEWIADPHHRCREFRGA